MTAHTLTHTHTEIDAIIICVERETLVWIHLWTLNIHRIICLWNNVTINYLTVDCLIKKTREKLTTSLIRLTKCRYTAFSLELSIWSCFILLNFSFFINFTLTHSYFIVRLKLHQSIHIRQPISNIHQR